MTVLVLEVEDFATTLENESGLTVLVLKLKGQQNTSVFMMEPRLAREIGESLMAIPQQIPSSDRRLS